MRILLACTIAVSASAAELTDATSTLFSGSANCAFCHDQWRNGLTDRKGRDVSIAGDEPIQVSSRPPWLGRRKPFWRHQFVGGNAFLLQWLKDQPGSIEPNAEPAQFEAMIAMVRQQLARAASVSVRGRRESNDLVLQVEVRNLTGHKFPTGHPYRRAWLHVTINDAAGRMVFESGGYDERGRLLASDGQMTPHLDVITQPGQVQVYESVMGDAAGAPTHSLLSAATYLKDNRLPPQGFRAEGPGTEHTAIRGGAEHDANFNPQGSGSDQVTYRVPVGRGQGPWTAEVTLLYQSVPPETVAGLLQSRGPAAQEFSTRYLQADHEPERIGSARLKI
jgi:hypothetical protein